MEEEEDEEENEEEEEEDEEERMEMWQSLTYLPDDEPFHEVEVEVSQRRKYSRTVDTRPCQPRPIKPLPILSHDPLGQYVPQTK